jgi:hypothetical protein
MRKAQFLLTIDSVLEFAAQVEQTNIERYFGNVDFERGQWLWWVGQNRIRFTES